MKWEIQISGDTNDLNEMSQSLIDDELRIYKKNDRYFMTSNRFDSLIDYENVYALANNIIELLTGAAHLSLNGRTSLQVASVIEFRPDGKRNIYVGITDTAIVGAYTGLEISRSYGTTEVIHPAHRIPLWIKLGLEDKNVEKALRLLGSDKHDWVSLYRLYEVIEGEFGESRIVNNGWATKTSIKRFKHTANSPNAVGDASRHGKETTNPPVHPMSIGEALSLIKVILYNWLHEKEMSSMKKIL